MNSLTKFAVFAGLAAAASIGSISPAHALTGCMAGDVTGDFQAGELAAFGTGGTVTECIIGDKKYSNFSYTSVGGTGVSATDTFQFSQLGASQEFHNLNVQSSTSFLGTTVTLTYTIEILAPSTLELESYTSNITGDVMTSWAQSFVGNGGPSSTAGYPTLAQEATTPMVDFLPGTTSDTLTTTLIASNSGAGVTQFANRVTQTPGPLPILGAGAAFGFSRKLRKRIKSVA
jgi:hypothetical protein